jgi:acetyl esterase/lipase
MIHRFLALLIPLLAPVAYPMVEVKGSVPCSSSTNEIIIDLSGKKLPGSPNPIVPRWGLIPGITLVDRPVLLLRKTTRTHPKGTILVFPGGGYSALAIMHEGELVADFLNRQGFDAAILEYSIGRTPSIRGKALRDARKAWNLLTTRGGEWGLNTKTVGIMGFSAGGHLAARLTHVLGRNHGPDFLVMVYPAYLEERAGPEGLDPAVAPPKDSKARLFVVIGDKDKPNWIRGASVYAQAWRHEAQIVDFHLLAGAGHGFGMKPDRTGSASRWERLLEEFLAKTKFSSCQ